MNFYLDDYDLIKVRINQKLYNSDLKVLFNGEDVPFEIKNDREHLFIVTEREYHDRDRIQVTGNGERYDVISRFISQTERFDREYCTDLRQLGSFPSEGKTVFRLWSPMTFGAAVCVEGREYEMEYLGRGLYECTVEEDLEGRTYHYKTLRHKIYEFTDPFSYADKDRSDSYVLDPGKFNTSKVRMEPYGSPTVYEMSVRDFSSDPAVPFSYPKKFLGIIEEGLKIDGKEAGFDYLKSLGVSHIQLMPVFSFDPDHSDYNWGYNPVTYNTLERSYLVSDDPYEQIAEFKKVIDTLHRAGIRVNLDVVYNHVYRHQDFNLDRMLPYYFFRYKDGKLGNASFCGNETRSESYFLREYLKLLTSRFIDVFDIDGLRFDIMGILDYVTLNEIYAGCSSKKADFMVYGEGWKLGDILPDEEKAVIENGEKMKHIGYFLDGFRNTLRGHEISDEHAYLLGDMEMTDKAIKVIDGSKYLHLDEDQAINYIECHDNYTFFDKLDRFVDDEELKVKIAKLGLSLVVLSRGVPFIHSGQEFLRTKKGIDNSYNCSDEINMLDWTRKNRYLEVSDYLRELLKLRHEHDDLYCRQAEISFDRYYEVLIYRIEDLCVFINPCIFDHIYSSDDEYELIFDEKGHRWHTCRDFRIPAFSIVVGYRMKK
ncbi:MAG: hypothetical protein IKF68_02355 [Erysipelotrichaceae bacterium]|nr:hypothetical protein [Erysipelotrichaceae bacterium]